MVSCGGLGKLILSLLDLGLYFRQKKHFPLTEHILGYIEIQDLSHMPESSQFEL